MLAIEHNYTEQVIAIAIANHLRLATGNTEWITVYDKTFEGENLHSFRGFVANRKSFPLESFAVYST